MKIAERIPSSQFKSVLNDSLSAPERVPEWVSKPLEHRSSRHHAPAGQPHTSDHVGTWEQSPDHHQRTVISQAVIGRKRTYTRH